MVCVMCRQKLHASCRETSCDCSQASHEIELDPSPTEESTEPNGDERLSLGNRRSGNSGTRRYKRDAVLKDQQSTGRKRAARLFPLDREASCEWSGMANCGGGLYPIVGCVTGLQESRHHGPDKSTSNNEVGNVHRICHRCHNRWHAANNAEYDWNSTTVKSHKPRPQTDEETIQARMDEFMFRARKEKKVKD